MAALGELVILYLSTDPKDPEVVPDEAKKRVYHLRKAFRRTVIVLSTLALLFCILHIALYHNREYSTTKTYFTIGLYLLSILFYLGYHWCDDVIIADKKRGKKKGKDIFTAQWLNTCIYFPIFVLSWTSLILAIWVLDLRSVVPESLILLVFSCYILLFDLIHYIAFLDLRIRYTLNIAATATVLVCMFMVRYKFQYLELKYRQDPHHLLVKKDLATIQDYYDRWKLRMAKSSPDSPYDIILVSGEGGGSRAGYWFTEGLLKLDSAAGGHLKEHIFSMSTVSGSSVGLGAMLSYWTFRQEKDIHSDSPWTGLPHRIFRYNFVGGNVAGLLVTDLFKSLIPFRTRNNRDWEQQNEEAECVQESLKEIDEGRQECGINFISPAPSDDGLILKRDIMSFYYDTAGKYLGRIKADLPLCFINTTRSSDSRRGIFTPIQLNPDEFKDALDICRFIYTPSFNVRDSVYPGQDTCISLGAACNTSELFPFFSAPTLIDSLGYFLDGGYHENSGLKTTMEVYEKLLQMLHNDSATINPKSYRITVIYFKNAPYKKTYYPGTIPHPIAGLQPVSAILNEPFTGSESYFEEAASVRLGKSLVRFQLQYDAFFSEGKIHLPDSVMPRSVQDEILKDIVTVKVTQKKNTERTVNFPLARWLSYFILDQMKICCDRELSDSVLIDPSFRDLLTRIRYQQPLRDSAEPLGPRTPGPASSKPLPSYRQPSAAARPALHTAASPPPPGSKRSAASPSKPATPASKPSEIRSL